MIVDARSIDALTVECPTCGAKVRAAYYYAPQPGTWWPRDPHPARIEAARAMLLSKLERSESLWLELAEVWRTASPEDRAAILAVVRVRQAVPAGVDELVHVIESGAGKHNGGELGASPRVPAVEHLEHALEHVQSAWAYPWTQDPETGATDAGHAAARLVLAIQARREGR